MSRHDAILSVSIMACWTSGVLPQMPGRVGVGMTTAVGVGTEGEVGAGATPGVGVETTRLAVVGSVDRVFVGASCVSSAVTRASTVVSIICCPCHCCQVGVAVGSGTSVGPVPHASAASAAAMATSIQAFRIVLLPSGVLRGMVAPGV